MAKKLVVVGIVLLLVGVFLFMRMRMSHMMAGQGSPSDLVAVSADGARLSSPVTGQDLPAHAVAQQLGDMLVTLAINPYPPSVGAASSFDITLRDGSGNAIEDAVISLDLTMPSMWMPPNQADAKIVSAGVYQAQAPFTMRGMWRIEVIITRGGASQSAFFDVGL
jgi:hypothetical protein